MKVNKIKPIPFCFRSNPWANQRNPSDFLDRKELRYSHSTGEFPPLLHGENEEFSRETDSFSPENASTAGKTPTSRENKCNNNSCGAFVGENSQEIHHNGRAIIEKLRRKKQRSRRANSDGSIDRIVEEPELGRHQGKGMTSVYAVLLDGLS